MEDNKKLVEKILKLKEQKNAVILAHYYTNPEVQDIADFLGDSLGLSQKAAKTDADIIVFCGVHFMAETASIISPDKKVLIPDLNAGCSLSDSINIFQLREWKKKHTNAVVITYVNTTAEIKAESDYCCTSANAAKVAASIPKDKEILFLPDKHLGKYAKLVSGKNMLLWNGECHVHKKITDEQLINAEKKHPYADILIHPECDCSDSFIKNHKNVYLYSTAGMVKHAQNSPKKEFLIATEVGMLHQLRIQNPDKKFYPVFNDAVCEYMKLNSLEKIYRTLKNEEFEIKVPENIAVKAKLPIERMLKIV